ncbi:hypothetical protein [Flammeovirga sp. SJP92]|uniref:hypothetical protein n=1 Tax=Flammeovirga sp. SJP92 TaxID=1775430 RepID=UPI000787A941|nr:hypothetical protein [Flammeovirga sp. SJP92]KXX69092.1 hypothetical protein AVL50_16775 [Flammeovirga sp. SJP92]
MKKIITSLALLGAMSCSWSNLHNQQENTSENEKKSNEKKVYSNKTHFDSQEKDTINVKDINGIWYKKEEKVRFFRFDSTKVHYFNHPDQIVKYELASDGILILIYSDDFSTKNKVLKLNSNELVIETEIGIKNYFIR